MIKLLKIAIILFFLGTYLSFSQYTEIINSNRPGNSSGAFSVGQDILQLENGFYYSNEKHDLLNYTAKGYGFNFNIRYGFLTEKLEIVLNGVFHADKLKDHRYTPSNNYNRKNFKDFKIGAKYLVFDPRKNEDDSPNVYSYWADKKFNFKNLIPAISIFIGLNVDSKNNPFTAPNIKGVSPSISLITQSNFTNRSALIINLNSTRIGSNQNDFEYIFSLTHAFNEKFIAYIEKHGIKSDFYAENKLSFGLTYLFKKNIQFDLGSTTNFKNTPEIFNINLGFSYRYQLNKTND